MTDRVSKIILRADISDLQAKMVAAGRSLKSVAEQSTAATKESRKFREGLTSAGDAAGKMALVTGAAFTGIVATAANFEQSMSNVRAATHESARAMEDLREAALDAGSRTVFSASEAAAAIENLAKAGLATGDILGGGLDGALDLAAAGTLDVADAAEIAATAMSQFGLSGDQVPHVADLLAAAAGKAQGEVSDMAMALKQSGLVANQVGLSIEETTAALAAFAHAGLIGSDAGTSLKTMLGALTPNSKKAADTMKELGISAFDATGQFIGLEAFAGNLRAALSGLTDEQRAANLEVIFGSDAVRAASELYNQGASGIREWTAAVDDQGFAAETARIKLDNLKGDIEALRGSLETLFITSGEDSQGFLRGAVQATTDFVNALNSLPGELKGLSTSLLGITAITGGSLWFGSRVIRGVAETRVALDALGESGQRAGRSLRSLSRVGGTIAAITILDSAVDSLLASMADAPPATEALAGSLLDLNEGKVKDLGKTFEGLAEGIESVKDASGGVTGFFTTAVPNITGLLPGENSIEKLDRFRRNIDALDEALATLVGRGAAEQAADALAALGQQQGLTEKEMSDLKDLLPGYAEALAGAANDARLAAAGEGALGSAAKDATSSIEAQTTAIKDNIDKMREKRDLALAAENAEIGFQQALDDARHSLKENGATLDITTEKGRENKRALLDVAASWNELTDKQKNAKGARRDAIDDFVDLAEKMGMSEKAARLLANRLFEMPAKVVTKVTVETFEAKKELDAFVRYASGRRIVIGAGLNVAQARAEGGPVYGPGTKTSDSIPALLSNGEFVVKADSVDKYGLGLLWDINAGRFAEGGYASRGGEMHGARSYTTNHYYSSAAAVRAAPVFENVTVKANDMREFVAFGRNTQRLVDGGGVAF